MKKVWMLCLILMVMLSGNQILGNSTSMKDIEYPKVNVEIKNACDHKSCGEGYNIAGTTYVPLRLVMETMGATVEWDSAAKVVSIIPIDEDKAERSEEHTSELQSRPHLVCRLL